jgi:hypothetical protein
MTKPRFDISLADYETSRHVFDMWRWINETLRSMRERGAEDDGDPNAIYFERRGENVKKLIEEAIPTAYLALYLFRQCDDVYVQCKAGNQNFDALIDVKGFRNFSIKVEVVTTTEDEETALRRQELGRTGFVFLTGPIRRDPKSKSIEFEPQMVDVQEEEQKWLERAYKGFLEKVESNRYGEDTAVLVNIDTYRSFGMRGRTDLVTKTFKYLRDREPKIYGVFYCYKNNFIIDEVKASSTWLE